ncbi:peroxidase 43 isoform X2 [Prunus avium]|uniref:Peroxidase n=1 Tax=Prunus avium TaxID=42229 RepID=A0A6P5TGH6_PRUAV|nr:peroxidase 43 isoform X2 [Prunus avium]
MALVLAMALAMVLAMAQEVEGQLMVGFYGETCPQAESIVLNVVREAILSDTNMAPVLLRLHFHDCFVEGCDGSILIENGPSGERHAFGHQGVGGFEVIEKAKAELEAACQGVVSCADIVALAARDAIAMAGGPAYEVPTGRRDGVVSNMSLADDMPDVSNSIQQLKVKFMRKGLTEKDLVLLSGGGSDPAINPTLLLELKQKCPQNGDVNVRLPIDQGSGQAFDLHILQNIRNGFAVLESDAKLNEDAMTRGIMDNYFGFFSNLPFGPSFEADFVEAILKMGQIGVRTGFQGAPRRVCASF